MAAIGVLVLEPLVHGYPLALVVVFAILATGTVLFSSWVFRVIERQQRDLELAETLLTSVRDYAIFMVDPKGRVVSWTEAASKIKGYAAAEIIGRHVATFYTADDVAAGLPDADLRSARETGRSETEGWRVRQDGSQFWANVATSTITDEHGRLIGFAKVTRDITEQRQAMEQIEQLNAQLAQSVKDLRHAKDRIERRNRELAAAGAAIAAVSNSLRPADVLQRIVDEGRDLVHARYAALGVADESGHLTTFITSGITVEQREAIGPLPKGHGLLGQLIREAKPLRVPDISRSPESVGFPENHPPMTSLLGVPILYQGKAVGDLYMTDKVGAPEFSEEDEALLTLLASHAAVAITNARLYEEAQDSAERLRQLNLELEHKVAERTKEIERYSRELTRRVLVAQEEERKRIARELHDETAQSLSTLLINLDLLELQVPPGAETMQAGLDRLRILAKRTLDETRALSHDLRPTILDDVGLVAAIQWFADEFQKSYGVSVMVDASEVEVERLQPETHVALFRIVQEALTNAGKHANASSVSIGLEVSDGLISLRIEDDGQGFDVQAKTGPSRKGGLGLYGIQERAELLSGTLRIESTAGSGTTILVTAPAKVDDEQMESRDAIPTAGGN